MDVVDVREVRGQFPSLDGAEDGSERNVPCLVNTKAAAICRNGPAELKLGRLPSAGERGAEDELNAHSDLIDGAREQWAPRASRE